MWGLLTAASQIASTSRGTDGGVRRKPHGGTSSETARIGVLAGGGLPPRQQRRVIACIAFETYLVVFGAPYPPARW